MIEMNAHLEEQSWSDRARKLLDDGDISSALELYSRVFDPDSLDEEEARSMLIEARSHLTRKRLPEALESFEEALVMGTEVQRRQALDGITGIAELLAKLKPLTRQLHEDLKAIFRGKDFVSKGLATISENENLVLISEEAVSKLPNQYARSLKVNAAPPHLSDVPLPFESARSIPYTDEKDIRFIIEVARILASQ